MAHVPVIVISPSDRRLEGMERVSGGPVIHSKLDVGTARGKREGEGAQRKGGCRERRRGDVLSSRMALERGGDRRVAK